MFRNVVKSSVFRTQAMSFSTGTPIGFLGLGAMGKHMATNLIKKGQDVVVYDVVADPAKDLEALGKSLGRKVTIAATPADVAAQVDTLITMLPNGKIVTDAFTGANGILEGAKKRGARATELLCIDSSTIETSASLEVYTKAKELGVRFIDAPVSGGVAGAEKGTLTFMCGSEPDAFERAKSVLELMGGKIVLCGANSTGLVAKIVNNLILAISTGAVAEGFNLGVALGADPEVLAQIVNTSTGKCWSSEVNNPCDLAMKATPRPALNDYNGGFQVDLMAKDLGIALSSAPNAALPLGRHILDLYKEISANGGGKKDFSYIYKYLQAQNK